MRTSQIECSFSRLRCIVHRIAALMAIVILLFHTGGHFWYFQWATTMNRHEMKKMIRQNLDSTQITLITLTPANSHEFKWRDKGKEFCYRGEMYDVIKKEAGPSGTRIFCVNDKIEKQLIKFLRQSTRNRRDNDRRLRQMTGNNLFFEFPGKTIQPLASGFRFGQKAEQFVSSRPEVKPPPPRLINAC